MGCWAGEFMGRPAPHRESEYRWLKFGPGVIASINSAVFRHEVIEFKPRKPVEEGAEEEEEEETLKSESYLISKPAHMKEFRQWTRKTLGKLLNTQPIREAPKHAGVFVSSYSLAFHAGEIPTDKNLQFNVSLDWFFTDFSAEEFLKLVKGWGGEKMDEKK